MTNKLYRKGCRLERKVVNWYRDFGWIAFRSAGSHSPFDVVAISPGHQEIRLIQCKNMYMSSRSIEKLVKELPIKSSEHLKLTVIIAHRPKQGSGFIEADVTYE